MQSENIPSFTSAFHSRRAAIYRIQPSLERNVFKNISKRG